MRKTFLPFITFLFFTSFLSAQNSAEPGGFRHITVRDGLPSSEVYKILQDRFGYLWMCTDAGVCRYNGYSFQSFTTRDGLTDNTVFWLKEDNSGKLWTQGFSGALSYFDGKKFIGIPANDSLVSIYNNGQKMSFCVVPDSAGGITVGGLNTGGCFRVGPEDNFRFPHPIKSPGDQNGFRVTWISEGKHILSYAANNGNERVGLFYHDDIVSRVNFPEGNGTSSSNVVLLTHDKRILFSYLGHLYCINPDGKVIEKIFPGTIVGLDEDRAGNIWVSIFYGGVYLCPNGNFDLTEKCYFAGKTVSGVFEDSENGYWFSTVGDGIFYLPDLRFGYLTTAEGLPENNIQTLAAFEKNHLLIGFPNGKLGIFNPDVEGSDRFKYSLVSESSPYPIEALYSYHDTILASINGYMLMDSTFRIFKSMPDRGHGKGMVKNTVTGNFLFYSSTQLTTVDPKLDSINTMVTKVRYTVACYSHDGTLWLGALKGLWKMKNGKPFFMGDSIPGLHMRIDGITEDRFGNLWIATRGEGVFAVYGKQKWHFGEEEGVAGNTCRAITIDEQGRIWVGTNRGVSLISGFDRTSGKATIRSFNTTNGLLCDEVKCLLCNDGKLWMGSNEGLCWIDISSLTKNAVPPPTYITNILFGTDSCKLNTPAEFGFSDKTIRVFVEGLCFHDPLGLRYKYRLLGGDEDWITTANREISFSGLSPGNYRLEIFAVDSDGTQSTRPCVFVFRILTPFYRTWWFILFIVLVLGGITWGAISYRTKKTQKRAEEKLETEKRIAELRLFALRAQMNPHFIFNAINSIQHFVLQNDSTQAYNYLAKFSRLIRLVLDQSQSESIPLEQELKMLNLYIELEQLRFERPLSFEIKVDPELEDDNIRIPGMMVQPFVENAIWHGLLPKKSGEAWIKISFVKSENDVVITIEDNGVGRSVKTPVKPEDGKRRSYGLQITEERLRLSENKNSGQPLIKITDLKDENGNPSGTKIEIKLLNAALNNE